MGCPPRGPLVRKRRERGRQGEFDFVALASGRFTDAGPTGSISASARVGMADIGGGSRVRLNRDAACELYGLGELGYYRFLASGSVVASGAPGAAISIGAGRRLKAACWQTKAPAPQFVRSLPKCRNSCSRLSRGCFRARLTVNSAPPLPTFESSPTR
jgi:hypothetical protein